MNKKEINYRCEASFVRKLFVLFKIALAYLVMNNILSRLRDVFKKLFPKSLVRKFDVFRQSKNEQEFQKNALISSDIQSCDVRYQHVEQLVFNYQSIKTRPSDTDLQSLLECVDTYEVCLDFYDALFVNGLMKESLLFRNKARDLLAASLLIGSEKSRGELRKQIAAAREKNWDLERINSLLNSVPHNLVAQGTDGVHMYSESIQYIETLNYGKYHQMLLDKNVAILGPAEFNESELMKELESIDVLILTNVLADSDIINTIKGLNIKIVSYYNAFNAKKIFYDPKLNPGKYVDFFIYSDVGYAYQATQLVRRKARVFNKNPYMLCGAPQAFQSILYDLARFNARSIKVFGVTFYASKVSYRRGYSTPLDRVLYDLARHDAIGNFVFAKQIFDEGFFNGDSEVERILNMDNKEYLEVLEGVFRGEE